MSKTLFRSTICALLALALSSCGSPPAPQSSAAPATLAGTPRPVCAAGAAHWESAEGALAAGQWLRARRYFESALTRCPEATAEAHARLGEALNPKQTQHFDQVQRALVAEKEQQARIELTPRWAYAGAVWSRAGRYLLLQSAGQVQVLDTQTGKRVGHAAEPPLSLDAGQYEPLTQRLLLLKAGDINCPFRLSVFDAESGRKDAERCASNWAFDVSGSKLAVADILRMGDGAEMALSILDARSLKTLQQVAPPGGLKSNLSQLVLSPDGNTLAVGWGRGVSLVNLATGAARELGTQEARLDRFSPDGRRLLWVEEPHVVGLDLASDELVHRRQPECGRPSAALSPDGERVAFACGAVLFVGDANLHEPLGQLELDAPVWSVEWLAHGGALRVLVLEDGRVRPRVVTARKLRPVIFTTPEETVESVSLATGLAFVEKAPHGPRRLVRIGSDGSPEPVAEAAGCEPYSVFEVMVRKTPAAHALGELGLLKQAQERDLATATRVMCEGGAGVMGANETEPSAPSLLFEGLNRTPQRFTTDWEGVIEGEVLTHLGPDGIVLYSKATQRPLAGSPRVPRHTQQDGYWDGPAFVSGAKSSTWPDRLVSQFEPRLRVAVERAPLTEQCAGQPASGHAARLSWRTKAPYEVCERRSGKVVGHLPLSEPPGYYARPQLSADGKLFISDEDQPRLLEFPTGKPVALEAAPSHGQFAGALLVGYDAAHYGVWAANGSRLGTWTERKELPIAAHAGLELALVKASNRPLSLRALSTGEELATLQANATGDVRFAAHGLLSVVERQWVSFFRVPPAGQLRRGALPQRLGRLLAWGADADAQIAFITDEGTFETSAEVTQFAAALRCAVGAREMPFALCADAFLEPGLAGRLLLAE